jgi:hypothetical protein
VFRFDSLRPGQYLITIRKIGYTPLRSRIEIGRADSMEIEYAMEQTAPTLPTIVVEGRRAGIFGTVGDTAYRAIRGARVQVVGPGGGEVLTDSAGRFAVPTAGGGTYVVRVTFPGYAERRILVELEKRGGRELGIHLAPSRRVASRADDHALQDLRIRLGVGLERERLTETQLTRYASVALCDVPQIQEAIGRNRNISIAFSLNGVTIDTSADVAALCAWRADEVALVEFGKDPCRDASKTIATLTRTWCSGRSRNVPRSIMSGGQRVSTQSAGKPYVIVWEKR